MVSVSGLSSSGQLSAEVAEGSEFIGGQLGKIELELPLGADGWGARVPTVSHSFRWIEAEQFASPVDAPLHAGKECGVAVPAFAVFGDLHGPGNARHFLFRADLLDDLISLLARLRGNLAALIPGRPVGPFKLVELVQLLGLDRVEVPDAGRLPLLM